MENQESIYEEKQGNLLTGILGAFLGALIGTALWVLVGVWGYVASIVAWLTAFLAGKGYDLLHGRPGKAKGHHDYRNADSVDLRRYGGNSRCCRSAEHQGS